MSVEGKSCNCAWGGVRVDVGLDEDRSGELDPEEVADVLYVCNGDDGSAPGCVCAEDEQVLNNQCVACPPGSTNPAGDDANGVDTACEATLCAENERVLSNECVACLPGQSNPGGDDASGSDTSCSVIPCTINQYVSSNECIDCSAGFGRDAGDDPSGADTACTETYLLFVSSSTHTGNFGGLAGADAICQGLATSASVDGTFVALLSTSTVDAIDRIAEAAYPIRLVNGTKVANNRADFFDNSGLLAAPNRTETNQLPVPLSGAIVSVMTGSTAAGTATAGHCSDWTSVDGSSAVGFSNNASSGWFGDIGYRGCNAPSTEHIYCIGR